MWSLCVLLLSLHPLFSTQRALHTAPPRSDSVDLSGPPLAAGAACGVYTSRCGPGLKCVPQEDESKPLKALLEGRGRCGLSDVGSTAAGRTTDAEPTEASEQGPCRRRLLELLSALGPQLLRPQQDLYLPNCDLSGFFKRRQCWSSRGRQRGRCWCVDEDGTPLTSNSTQTSDC